LSWLVAQSPALYDGLSVDDHLDLAVLLRPEFDRPYARRRLDELGIPGGQGAKSLSGGQQAQVALALALGTRARILLLDEPLASLDPLARREFLHVLVDAVRADGSTALLSSHVITDIEQACDRLLVLGAGRTLLDLSDRGRHRRTSGDRRRRRRCRGPAAGFGRGQLPGAGRRETQPCSRRRVGRRPAGHARGGRPRPPCGGSPTAVDRRD